MLDLISLLSSFPFSKPQGYISQIQAYDLSSDLLFDSRFEDILKPVSPNDNRFALHLDCLNHVVKLDRQVFCPCPATKIRAIRSFRSESSTSVDGILAAMLPTKKNSLRHRLSVISAIPIDASDVVDSDLEAESESAVAENNIEAKSGVGGEARIWNNSALDAGRGWHTAHYDPLNPIPHKTSLAESQRQSRWSCCFCAKKADSAEYEDTKTTAQEHDVITKLTEKSLATEEIPVTGLPKTRGMLHPHQLFWHLVKCHFSFYVIAAGVMIFAVSTLMWIVIVITEVDCNGLLVRLGVRNPNNRTGIYSSCDDAPSTLAKHLCDQFFFCVQTITTVGYGVWAPYNWGNTVISTVFGWFGFVAAAIYCGIAFARYSLIWQTALVAHSCHAVVTTFRGA